MSTLRPVRLRTPYFRARTADPAVLPRTSQAGSGTVAGPWISGPESTDRSRAAWNRCDESLVHEPPSQGVEVQIASHVPHPR